MYFYSSFFVDLAAQPLDKIIPVDEFLPIMFNQHQNDTWKNAYPTRNLIAWSAAPLLLFPTHYIGDDGYLSDTEESVTIDISGKFYDVYIFRNQSFDIFCIVSGDRGSKEETKNGQYNDNGTDHESQSIEEVNSNVNGVNVFDNTTFIINSVNEQVIVDKSAEQKHSEL